MTNLAIKHYNLTFANQSVESERRIIELRKQFRTRLSKRRAKQALKSVIVKLYN